MALMPTQRPTVVELASCHLHAVAAVAVLVGLDAGDGPRVFPVRAGALGVALRVVDEVAARACALASELHAHGRGALRVTAAKHTSSHLNVKRGGAKTKRAVHHPAEARPELGRARLSAKKLERGGALAGLPVVIRVRALAAAAATWPNHGRAALSPARDQHPAGALCQAELGWHWQHKQGGSR